MYLYEPVQPPPRKWCGCLTYVWCNHAYVWPGTTTTIRIPEKPEDGYVGKHRKPD